MTSTSLLWSICIVANVPFLASHSTGLYTILDNLTHRHHQHLAAAAAAAAKSDEINFKCSTYVKSLQKTSRFLSIWCASQNLAEAYNMPTSQVDSQVCPLPFPPLPFPDNGGDVGRYETPQNWVWGESPAANEIPCILVEIWLFPGILEPFLR